MSAKKSAGEPDGEQQRQRYELAVETNARGDAGREQDDHQAVMRGGLDEGDRARQHGDEQDDVQETLRQRGGGLIRMAGISRRERALAQYAFSVRSKANGVCRRMYMSSRIDQFSM